MRDLYRHLDLVPASTTESVRAAIERVAPGPLTEAARHILLDPRRREVYDRHHRVLSQIGQLRANLGLSRTQQWLGSGCSDFDVLPTGDGSRLDEVANGRPGPAGRESAREAKSHNVGCWVMAMIVGIGAAIGVFNSWTEETGPRPSPRAYQPSVPRTEMGGGLAEEQLESIREFLRNDRGEQNVEEPLPTPLPLPATGVMSKTFSVGLAPLEIKTRRGNGNYFVKVVDWWTNEEVMTLFIRDGDRVDTTLPLGSYRIKYAVGQTWYGPELGYRFGPSTAYSRADDRFDFIETDDGYIGYTVELILQVDGNLETVPIRPEDF